MLYYITDRSQFSGTEDRRRAELLHRIEEASLVGIDYIQLREKDLRPRELESLACEAVQLIRASRGRTRLLINSRTDVAWAAGADGVHLASNDLSPENVRRVWSRAQGPSQPVIAVSCHRSAEVIEAEHAGADFVVFGPVFEKNGSQEFAQGITALREACRTRIPVLALGGVNLNNARESIEAGAKGIAGIRLFQKDDLKKTVEALRKLQ
jgi:thiamine-phosphate pyrophosphorylase